nr:hypothetical protein [Oscillospiraceae bacterium]
MEFQWILLALFLVAVISGMSKALSKSMLKNTLRLGSVVVAFLITFVMQLCGVFQNVVTEIINLINLASMMPGLEGAADLIGGLASTLVSPIFFIIVFFPILWIIRIVVHFVVKGIEKANEKKADAIEQSAVESAPVNEEKAEAEAVEENTEAAEENADAAEESAALSAEEGAELTEKEEAPSEDQPAEADETPAEEKAEVAAVTEEKPKKEKKEKKKKKSAIYPECAWKRAVSIASGAISSLLVLAVFMMPFFYLMSVVSSATDAIEGSDADDSQIYKVVDVVDEYIVDPYEESFFAGFYNTVGVSKLMNYTTRAGGKIVLDNGTVVYADDVLKGLVSNGVSVAAQITSAKSECTTVKENIDEIINDPMISSILADVVMMLLDDMETEEPAEDDLIGGIVANFTDYYKNADKETISQDLQTVGGAIGVLAEERVLAALISGNADFESMLSDEETLGDVVEAISGLSVFGPTLEDAFGLGIELLGETLHIPEDDAAVYGVFMEDLLDGMVKDKNTAFDLNTINGYVKYCASKGKVVSGINGYAMFLDYTKHWTKVQSAFAHASEDKSYGYFTIIINGECYVYDHTKGEIHHFTESNPEIYEAYKNKVSPQASIINYLALTSSTKKLTADDLYDRLEKYAASNYADARGIELANRILAKDGFTTNAVTVEKMLDATNFSDWTAEEKAKDGRLCVAIITDLLGLMDTIGNLDTEDGLDAAYGLVDQFVVLGNTMDIMGETSCINKLPVLLIEGLVKSEMLSDFISPSTAFQCVEIVESNEDLTYSGSMVQISGLIETGLSIFGGVAK